jgi:hypothetical protein
VVRRLALLVLLAEVFFLEGDTARHRAEPFPWFRSVGRVEQAYAGSLNQD